MGEQCPIPVIKTRKAIQELKEPATVEVHVDNATAEQNILRLASTLGIDARSMKTERKHFVISMNVRRLPDKVPVPTEEAAPTLSEEAPACCPAPAPDTVVAIGSEGMGSGSDELGGILIKGFIYAVSHLDTLPKAVVFFNGGAKLTVEGSPLLEDLKYMEMKGVEILTCGTCLDYYGIKEKLSVGKVTNMYNIVELLNGADKIIKP